VLLGVVGHTGTCRKPRAMNTLRWLAVVLLLASALAVIRGLLGESLVAMTIFLALAVTAVHFGLGGRNWTRAGLGGLIAAAAYAALSTFFAR
jgi:hypothetical protein